MSLSPETMLELMALADGELEGDARARAEKRVAEDEEARRIWEAMRAPHLGTWLGDAMHRSAEAAGADGIADAVMARIAAAPASEEPPVVRVGRVQPIRGSRLRVAVAAGVAGLALAAAVALFARSRESSVDSRMPVASVGAPSMDYEAPGTSGGAPGQGVEVDEIDSPSRGISVFEIPLRSATAAAGGTEHPSSVVIWIEDDPGPI
jgi:anti-sigma factor RsiW